MEWLVSGRLPANALYRRSRSMPRPKHLVKLTLEEREQLRAIISAGTASAYTQRHARILLKADCGAGGPACDDASIAEAVAVSRPTVERVRAAFAKRGLAAALHRKAWSGRSEERRVGKGWRLGGSAWQ